LIKAAHRKSNYPPNGTKGAKGKRGELTLTRGKVRIFPGISGLMPDQRRSTGMSGNRRGLNI
jgi:hypothetical protein